MDWFLYDNVLRHERVKQNYQKTYDFLMIHLNLLNIRIEIWDQSLKQLDI